MNISEFCIRRPVFTVLLMAAALVGGITGYLNLSVNALPDIDLPTISVTANLPGASPDTMSTSVATPLEKQFSTIPGLSSMSSNNFLGTTQITLQFNLERNIDAAALDVQTAISAVAKSLPAEMATPPFFQKVNPAEQPIIFIAVSSGVLPLSMLNEYVETLMSQRISTLAGVSQVMIYGSQKYAVRVQVDPGKLADVGYGLDELSAIIASTASNTPLGLINGPKQLYYLDMVGQPKNAEEFSNLIAIWRNGSPIRVKDIAVVKDSVENVRAISYLNGKQGIILAVQKQQSANTIEVVKSIRALLPAFKSSLPASIEIKPLFDRSISIQESVKDVQFSLILTIILVVLVIFMFLHNVRSTIIPAIAVPLSIIITYGGMKLFGFSINNISLLAITLCVGLVVDDAIVMMENIIRYIEQGKNSFEAALIGAKEVGFTIISISVSLIAVFIPILFMEGIIGRLFREFAVTISFAILVSGVVSLTLTPMLCSKILKSSQGDSPSRFGVKFDLIFNKIKNSYIALLEHVIQHKFSWLIATLAMLILTIYLAVISAKGFFPVEDTGFVFAQTEGTQDVSYNVMLEKQKALAKIISQDPAVDSVFHALGGSNGVLNSGKVFFGLKPLGQRPHIREVINRIKRKITAIPGINLYMQPIQNLRVGGKLSKSMYQYTIQSSNSNLMYKVSEDIKSALVKEPGFANVTSDLQLNSLKLNIQVNPELAAINGITYDKIRHALYSAFGTQQIGTLYTETNEYQIIFEIIPELQNSPDDLSFIYLKASSGNMIKLDSIATISQSAAPLVITHQNQLPSVNISFDLKPDFSLSEAIASIKKIEQRLHLDKSVTTGFQGNAQVFSDSLNSQGLLIILSIVVIYIILGMLYESFAHPVTILCGLPAAGCGAIIVLMIFGKEIDVMAVIGIILLIGIVKKNSIMMVDFAISQRQQGEGAIEAIMKACALRFRPIMMTTLAALSGTLPIAIGIGAGSELRQPLGIAVVGGLLTSQFLTLFITPVIYLYLEEIQARFRKKA